MDSAWRTKLEIWNKTFVTCFRCGERVLISKNKGTFGCRQHKLRANRDGIHPCCGAREVDPGHANALGCVPCDHPTKSNLTFTHRHDDIMPVTVARELPTLRDDAIVEIMRDGYFDRVRIRRFDWNFAPPKRPFWT